jgi:dihydroflavonol-4-reductase
VSSTSQILISGATGFVGRYLVRALLEREESVALLVRSEDKARALFGDRVRYCHGDLHDKVSLETAMKGVTMLYHLGGLYAFGRSNAKALMEVNVQGTENILEAAAKAGVSRVVHVSSAGILARREKGADENSFPSSQPQGRPYKASKWLAEHVALGWAEKGLPVVIANPTCPLGPEDNTPTGQIIRDFLEGRFLLSCRTGLNFLDCRDLAQGLMACAERGRPGERYVLGHYNLMLTDFLNMLSAQTGLPGPKAEVPWPVIAVAAAGSEGLQSLGLIKTSSRLSWETAQQSRFIQFFDSSKARTELGWQPRTPLQDTLQWTLESYGWKEKAAGRILCKG